MGAVRAVSFHVAAVGAPPDAACYWPPALFTLTPFSLTQGQGICPRATVATFVPAITPRLLLPLQSSPVQVWVYGLLVGLTLVMGAVRAVAFYVGAVRAGTRIHDLMVDHVLR